MPVALPVPEWAGQSVQPAADAATSLKVPAEHATIALPLPVKPTSAKQLLSKVKPLALPELECSGQSVHAAEDMTFDL